MLIRPKKQCKYSKLGIWPSLIPTCIPFKSLIKTYYVSNFELIKKTNVSERNTYLYGKNVRIHIKTLLLVFFICSSIYNDGLVVI